MVVGAAAPAAAIVAVVVGELVDPPVPPVVALRFKVPDKDPATTWSGNIRTRFSSSSILDSVVGDAEGDEAFDDGTGEFDADETREDVANRDSRSPEAAAAVAVLVSEEALQLFDMCTMLLEVVLRMLIPDREA